MATATQAQKDRQASIRRARVEQGYSSDCARSNHERCHVESCPCRCHHPAEHEHSEKTSPASAAAKRAWETRRAGEQAPKRPDLKAGVKRAISAPQARQVKSLFSIGLWGADEAAAKFLPTYWETPDDRLTDAERTSLVNAVYAVLEAYFPQYLVWLAQVGESAPLANLLLVCTVIAAPRLAHHKVIPESLANAVVFAPLLFAQAGAAPPDQPEQQPAAVDPFGATEPDRTDGNGQINFGSASVDLPPVQVGAAVEAGHGEVRHGQDDPSGARNGQHAL